MIKKRNHKLDLFDLLRLPEEEIVLPYDEFKATCELVLNRIKELKSQGMIGIAPHLSQKMDQIIIHGLENVGMYHAKRPVLKDKQGDIITEDMSLLYFYHNRLDGYALEKLF